MTKKVRSFKRNAKIVCTLGPASNTVEVIKDLIKAGMNICRVNMSHGTHEGHADVIGKIRQASEELDNREVAILMDLQGPKIRVDKLPEPLKLEEDSTWVIGPTRIMKDYPEYADCFIPTIYEKLVEDSGVGERVLFDDGLMVAEITEKDREVLKIKVSVGGELKSNKGINLPDTDVTAPSFTEKDRADLEFGLTQDIDYIALSFVRTKQDVVDVKNLLQEHNKDIPIISKIEKPQAIENIAEIMSVTDAIMVARGDMAVEVGNHLVPRIQKDLIKRCNSMGMPIITATQMLESMVQNPSPTRAEASDVANAIWDGTDAVMLSAESASGKYPLEAVTMMDKIIEQAEKTPSERPYLRNIETHTVGEATMVAASMIAEKVGAKRIIAVTNTGHSCLEMARFRPVISVLGVTDRKSTMRKMCLYWGIKPFFLKDYEKANSPGFDVVEAVKENAGLQSGDKVVVVRGDEKFFIPGSANSVKTVTV